MCQHCGRSASKTSTDRCRPVLCALGTQPHRHCVCGLPMATGATLCDLCLAEDFRPRPLKPADHLEEWDGVRYPSLRRNRPTDVPNERYEAFLSFVLAPVLQAEAASTAGEAA
jgi:hypothetical protein